MADMTLTEAAQRLGRSSSTLRHQIANGRLRARRLGSLWVVSERELERYRRESLGQTGQAVK